MSDRREARPDPPEVLRLPAVKESVPAARHAVSAIADAHGIDQFAVQTVVSELVGNAVVHAYVGREPGPIVVVVRVIRDLFVVTVADRGIGMKPRIDSPGLGIGIPLAGKLTHDLRIEANENGTTISASFEVLQSAASGIESIGALIDREIVEARRLVDASVRAGDLAPEAALR